MKDALIKVMMDGCKESPLAKARLKKKIEKTCKLPGGVESIYRAMGVDPTWETPPTEKGREWLWRLCCANLSLGNINWNYWAYRIPRNGFIPFDYPAWDGMPIDRLLVLGEQGLGDEIMFAACLKDIPAKQITLECEPRLEKVFQRNFPHIEVIGRKDLNDTSWTKGRQFDAMTLLGDLPTWYRKTKSDFPLGPYMSAEPDLLYKGAIGVSWKGRQGGYDPIQFAAKVPNAISLQYKDTYEYIETPDIDLNNDMEAVFSLISGLKRVVSVPTTVVHIAGALGIPTDVIMPPMGLNHGGFAPEQDNGLNWRWGMKVGRRFLWHSSVTIYESWSDYENYKT